MALIRIPGSGTIESTDTDVKLVGSSGAQPTIVQQVFTQDGSVATGTATYNSDDTIPQQTGETDIAITLAITPTDASNILLIEAIVNTTSTGSDMLIGLWRDSTEDAIATCWNTPETNDLIVTAIRAREVAGSTSTTTYKLGLSSNTGTWTMNGFGGAARFGGTLASTIMITELTP